MHVFHRIIAVLLLTLVLLTSTQSVAAQTTRPPQPSGRPALVPPIDVGSAAYVSLCGYGCAQHVDGKGTSNEFYYVDFSAGGNDFTVRAAGSGTLYEMAGIVGIGADGRNLGSAVTLAIDHGNGWVTSYAHLKPGSLITPDGKPLGKGERVQVRAGDKIATAGRSGADNVHLHFGLTIKLNNTTWSYPINDILDYAALPTSMRRGSNGLEIQFNATTPRIGPVTFTRLRIDGTNDKDKPHTIWDWNKFPNTTWSHTITGWWWKGQLTITFDTVRYGPHSCTVDVPTKGITPAIITYIGNNQCIIRS